MAGSRQSRKKRRRRKIKRMRNCILFLLLVLAAVFLLTRYLEQDVEEGKGIFAGFEDEQEDTLEIVTPVKWTEDEVRAKIAALAEENDAYGAIYADYDQYPSDMLLALVNNPEMLSFVSGYLESDGSVKGGLEWSERKQDYPLFLQWDERWGYAPYGESNIGLAGCGPTCLAMVLYSMTGNENITPDVIAQYSMDNGYYVEGTGTSWALMSDVCTNYGISSYQITNTEEDLKDALDKGRPLICSMGPGDFTTAGHFIMIYGYNEEGFFVNDPNSRARSAKRWSYDEIGDQIRAIWVFYES